MVFIVDTIIEHFNNNPQDFEALLILSGIGLVLFGMDLLIGAVMTTKIIEFLVELVDPCK